MSLLQLSFSGAVLVLLIVVVRALAIHRFPKKIFLALWLIAIGRLLLPFSLPLLPGIEAAEEKAHVPETIHAAVYGSHLPMYGTAAETEPVSHAQQTTFDFPLWTAVWAAGMSVFAGIFLLSYVKSKQEFGTALPLHNDGIAKWLREHPLKRKIEIRQLSGITTPMTYGLFRPVILLPENTDLDNKQQLEYILYHEYVHIRRFDTALKFLAAAALCVHWFNPMVWVLYVLFNRDIELACDECVVRSFGRENRAEYARTLISMEERKTFTAPFCNNFSKNAIEERIVSIMKTKRSSAAALFAAGVVTAVAAGAFVTSVQANDNSNNNAALQSVQGNGVSLSFGQTDISNFTAGEDTEITVADITITKVDEDGVTYYSRDGGETWTALTDEELEQYFSITNIEWWTYEEYAEWLENEKVELQGMIGEKAWTAGRGDFVWTQEIVDEAIAMYEEILENIRNGMLYSKSIGGENDQIVLSFDPTDIAQIYESDATAADFSHYVPFGLKWDYNEQALFFNGERVRYFCDGAEVEGGMAIRVEYLDSELKGDIDVHTVRERAYNSDGSYDPMGELTGLEKYSQEEFDARTFNNQSGKFTYFLQSEAMLEAVETVESVSIVSEVVTEELLKEYAPFGLSYSYDADGELRMSWQGKPVHSVYDGEKAVWIANNLHGSELGDGAIDLEAVYEQGKLVGLQETQELHGMEFTYVFESGTAETVEIGVEQGMTFAQRFEKYAPFGITYEGIEGSGVGCVYYNGQLVRSFIDLTPEGGAFTFTSAKQDDVAGIAVKTVYDDNGNLTGIETVTA